MFLDACFCFSTKIFYRLGAALTIIFLELLHSMENAATHEGLHNLHFCLENFLLSTTETPRPSIFLRN